MKLAFSISLIKKYDAFRSDLEVILNNQRIPYAFNKRMEDEDEFFFDYYVNDSDLKKAIKCVKRASKKEPNRYWVQ